MTARRPTSVLVALVACAALGGCGIADPYTRHKPARATTRQTPGSASRAHARATRALGTTAKWGRATAALRRYTRLSIDWSSRTLAGNQRTLAELAVAGARAQALQTAASYGRGTALQRSRVANRGQITSIAQGQGPRRGWWLITTQETTTGTGDYHGQPAQTHVYAAQLTHTPRGWKVSTWSPQS